jgi:DNA-binding MarR family transcriptional regulator
VGPCSQNKLGRFTAMDGATIKGVIDRLTRRGLTETSPDPDDGRLLMVALTEAGRTVAARAIPAGSQITEETLAPLNPDEQAQLLTLLGKLR